MSIKYPNILTSLPSTAFSNVSGQTALPVSIFDQNNAAFANPVNPPISVNSNLTLNGISDSGNIYEITGLTANITITLPTAAAGYNYTFIGNNTTSYTVTFSNGTMLFNGTSQSSLTLDLSGKNAYKFICDGTNWYVNAEASYGATPTPTANAVPVAGSGGQIATGWLNASTTPTANQIPVANASGVLNVSALTLLTNARQTAVFTKNGTWTVPAGVTTIYVSGCGGGAGGGAGITNSFTGWGGGAASSAILQAISVTAGHSLSITIGAGGAGSASGGANIGSPGGNTVLTDTTTSTTLLTLNGGSVAGNTSILFNSVGGNGSSGISSPFGAGANSSSATGENGNGYGSGGSGGGATSSTSWGGGNGAPGILIIQW